MTIHDAQRRPARRRRSLAVLLLAGGLIGGSCAGGDGASDAEPPTTLDSGPNAGALPTLAGGLELASVDPVRVLAGESLAYGQALPSQQDAADAFLEDPEVASVTARRIYTLGGRVVGDALVLKLDGAELFDQGVLDAFVRGVVTSLGDGKPADTKPEEVELGGRTTIRSAGAGGTTIAYVEGDLLVVVRGSNGHDVRVVVERQLAALAAGVAGAADPRTPLVPLPIDAAFVTVPTVTFELIPPPDEEPPPAPPTLVGATGVQGRYGVVAGERRTTVWAFTLDPETYPWAERLDTALAGLASARAGGAPAKPVEVLSRVVQRADGAEDSTSARAFRHEGLALLVEGADPAQLDAVVSAWIAALSAP